MLTAEVGRATVTTHGVGKGGRAASIHLDEEALVHVDVLTSGSRALRGTTLVLDIITLIWIIHSIGVSEVTIAHECCVLTDKGIEIQETLVGVTKEVITSQAGPFVVSGIGDVNFDIAVVQCTAVLQELGFSAVT